MRGGQFDRDEPDHVKITLSAGARAQAFIICIFIHNYKHKQIPNLGTPYTTYLLLNSQRIMRQLQTENHLETLGIYLQHDETANAPPPPWGLDRPKAKTWRFGDIATGLWRPENGGAGKW